MIDITVVIPTYNPNPKRLHCAIAGLKSQQLSVEKFEVVVVDNASTAPEPFVGIDFSWNANCRIVKEPNSGLTWARLRGLAESKADLICFVDDDNVLGSNYLSECLKIFSENESIGVIGGRVLPEFDVVPEPWVRQFDGLLALRDYGDEPKVLVAPSRSMKPLGHPDFLPVGAGMVVRRKVLEVYDRSIRSGNTVVTDRSKGSMSSGGDCDINLTASKNGWDVGYFPSLSLTHLIPHVRCTRDYLGRVAYGSSRSWPVVLASHGINPWRPVTRVGAWLRKIRSYFRQKSWLGEAHYVQWRGSCGLFDGLADLRTIPNNR